MGLMYSYGAKWTGTDISPEQIELAKLLSDEAGMDMESLFTRKESREEINTRGIVSPLVYNKLFLSPTDTNT